MPHQGEPCSAAPFPKVQSAQLLMSFDQKMSPPCAKHKNGADSKQIRIGFFMESWFGCNENKESLNPDQFQSRREIFSLLLGPIWGWMDMTYWPEGKWRRSNRVEPTVFQVWTTRPAGSNKISDAAMPSSKRTLSQSRKGLGYRASQELLLSLEKAHSLGIRRRR